ncbi:hypothetical protein OAH94_01665 [Amylibacter sp.]|nr:hypothetical protein [Amylibacter sp.]
MASIFKKFPVIIHQVAFLVAQFIILFVCGIGYSGSLAYIGATSSVLAILISLRWDVEIMVNKVQALSESLLDASVTISFMSLLILLVNVIVGSPISIHIFIAAIAIAIHELFVSILFVNSFFYIYAFFRTLPAFALIILALLGFKPEIIWPISFLLSASCLAIYFADLLKSSVFKINLERIKLISILPKLYTAITATVFTFVSVLFVVIITLNYGDEYAGIWSNSIRIFNSIIIFLLATLLPFTLNKLGDTNVENEKMILFFRLWISISPLIILLFFVVLNYGNYIFSLFTPLNFNVTNVHLSYIFLTGVSVSFIGSSQGLYQAMNKSIVLLCMLIVAQVFAFIVIYGSTFSFSSLVEIFLTFSLLLVFLILTHLTYCFRLAP